MIDETAISVGDITTIERGDIVTIEVTDVWKEHDNAAPTFKGEVIDIHKSGGTYRIERLRPGQSVTFTADEIVAYSRIIGSSEDRPA